MKGIIPASGSVEITVTFRPASLAVTFAEVELSVSQFEFLTECTRKKATDRPRKRQIGILVGQEHGSHPRCSFTYPQVELNVKPLPPHF